jgi:four helix bundle protein
MRIDRAKDLELYKKSYVLAMEIFEISKSFPTEERYALTGQIRRCSRSVCQNLQEAWAKRRYPAHFVSKITDCDGENSETETCLDFGRDCHYITQESHARLMSMVREVGRMIGGILSDPDGFIKNDR